MIKIHLKKYAFALFASILAGYFTHLLSPFMITNFSELLHAAVIVSAWYGGVGPGITAATLSFLIFDYFFTPPLNAFTGHKNFVSLFVFAAVAILTGSLSGQLKKTKSDLERAHDDLEGRIRQRTEDLCRVNADLSREILQREDAEKNILDISRREQNRLGQDLHDGLCQTLAGIKLLTGVMKVRLAKQSLPEATDAEVIESRLNEALTQADSLSRGLYPVELETNGLTSALEELCTKTSQLYSVQCRLQCRYSIDILDPAVATHLYRIAQEALINAIKTGKARIIIVRLSSKLNKLVLVVADDGVGIHPHKVRNGMGLKIMKYRARVIGGRLRIISKLKSGTSVGCSLQLK